MSAAPLVLLDLADLADDRCERASKTNSANQSRSAKTHHFGEDVVRVARYPLESVQHAKVDKAENRRLDVDEYVLPPVAATKSNLPPHCGIIRIVELDENHL